MTFSVAGDIGYGRSFEFAGVAATIPECPATASAGDYVVSQVVCADGTEITSAADCTDAIAKANAAEGWEGYGSLSSASYSFLPAGCSTRCFHDFAGYFCSYFNTGSGDSATIPDEMQFIFCKAPPYALAALAAALAAAALAAAAHAAAALATATLPAHELLQPLWLCQQFHVL